MTAISASIPTTDQYPLVEIQATELYGNALIASQDIHPGICGKEVFREKALIVFPPRGTAGDKSGPEPWTDDCALLQAQSWTDYWYFQQQSNDIQAKIMGLYVDMDEDLSRIMRTYIQKNTSMDPSMIDTFLQLLLIKKFNVVNVQPPAADGSGCGKRYGNGLYHVACRLTHSCHPNCTWFSSQDGTEKIVRVLRPILAGDILSIDYLGGQYKSQPIDVRRDKLQATKMFECHCERCGSDKDDTRRFACHIEGCAGVHFAACSIGTSNRLLDCTICGTSPSDEFMETMLRKEEEASTMQSSLEIQNSPLHPLHGLGVRHFERRQAHYHNMGDLQKATKCQEQKIACVEAIFGEDHRDESAGFDYETLGDDLRDCHDLEKAESAYQTAIHCFQIAYGDVSHPYYKCAIDKLLSLQAQLGEDALTTPGRCRLCGMATTQQECHDEWYCCMDHRMAHNYKREDLH